MELSFGIPSSSSLVGRQDGSLLGRSGPICEVCDNGKVGKRYKRVVGDYLYFLCVSTRPMTSINIGFLEEASMEINLRRVFLCAMAVANIASVFLSVYVF